MIAAKEVPKHRRMTIDEILGHIFKDVAPGMAGMFQWMMITVAVVLVNLIPIGLIIMNATGRYFSFYSDPSFAFDDLSSGAITAIIITVICVVLVDIFYSFFTTTWFTRLSLDAYSKVERSFGERMAKLWQDFKRLVPLFVLSFVGFSLLFGFIVILTLAAVGAGLTESGYDPTSGSPLDGLNLIINFISLLLSARLSSWLYLMIEDEMGLFEALKTTWQMSKGRMLRVIGYILLFSVILIFCVIGMMLGLGILWVPAIVTEFNLVVVSIVGFLTAVGLLFMGAVLTLVENNFYCAIYHALKRENTPEPIEPAETPESLIF